MVEKKNPLMEALEQIPEEDAKALAEAIKSIDFKKAAETIKLLSENMDTIARIVKLLNDLKESGALAALEAFTEGSDELFNAATRTEFMSAIANAVTLVYMLSQFSHPMLVQMAETMPKCTGKAMEELKKTEKGMGLFQLLSLMRSPEMAAAMKAMVSAIRCMKQA